MRFLHAGVADADEARFFPHFREVAAAGVAHAGAQAAHQLFDDGGNRAFVRHAAFDAFRHEFFRFLSALEVAVGGARAHRAERAHAAVGFVGAAFVKFDFARRFFGTGEQAADHDGMRAGSDGFGDVAGVA